MFGGMLAEYKLDHQKDNGRYWMRRIMYDKILTDPLMIKLETGFDSDNLIETIWELTL